MDTVTPSALSAAEAARKIREGLLTSEELVQACLERIHDLEPTVQAWTFLDEKHALAQARAADERKRSGESIGALHGVPVGVKDIIDTGDMPTENGTVLHRGRAPRDDAKVVAMLRAAGAVILGKTVTTECAYFTPGKTRNPHNPEHTPGGSSSGSAAAVGAQMVPLALGSQTAGSVIRPAAYCGAFAIKPSFGAINRAGAKFLSESLDTIGIMARGADDLGLCMQVLTGRALAGEPSRAPRIGLCRTPRWSLASPEIQRHVEQAAKALEKAGAKIQDFELPAGSDQLFDRHKVVMAYETARALGVRRKSTSRIACASSRRIRRACSRIAS